MSKSFNAVFSPQKFLPSLMDDSRTHDFEQGWLNNKPWILSNMSHIAYFKQSDIEAFMKALKAKKTCIYDKDGAQGFLAIWKNKAILVFRGSQPLEENGFDGHKVDTGSQKEIQTFLNLDFDSKSLRFLYNDVLADLKFKKTQFDDMEDVAVHRGFFREINKLWNNEGILTGLKECHDSNIPVWVTGHSLGAAMATLAGMRYRFESVITFGEPRVGSNVNLAFKSKSHIRYVNGADPVTMIPPELPFGYNHHGDIIKISDPDGKTDFKYDHAIVYYSNNLA